MRTEAELRKLTKRTDLQDKVEVTKEELLNWLGKCEGCAFAVGGAVCGLMGFFIGMVFGHHIP